MAKKSVAHADDLTKISGVGQRTQEKLYEAGIHTYADLANASLDLVSSAVTNAGRSKIESWQAEARASSQSASSQSNGDESDAYKYTNAKGRTYILHSRETQLKNGSHQTIYFFAKEAKEGAIGAVPNGYEVSETRNGLPVLKRQK